MTIPREDILAFDPPARRAGNVTLLPLTLAGAVRLAGTGVDLGKPVDKDRLFEVASVLAGEVGGRVAFLRRAKVGLAALSSAVEEVFNEAFATYIEAAAEKGGTIRLTPHGLGWPLELAEFLCAEYGWTFGEAAGTPVVRAFALAAAARQRNGGRHKGLDYVERMSCELGVGSLD